ncbi:uncharacterized protein LOC128951255 [Oppia nitens]|uniref:uncharacterized protein LOC128951255 n=1 Tax=Oppia nitens TaxID=1686743 RepID=UPI0023DABFFE|nr:uncharacterized protein LOC128951255 [Oppia nitens]
MLITWLNIDYTVGSSLTKSSQKTILHNISGCIELKTINGLIGASGSGKTNLLKCLNGFQQKGLSSRSTIVYNKNIVDFKSCFISQFQSNCLHQLLTVNQSLIYSSKLKNSCHSQQIDHQNNVDLLIEQFLLNDIKNSIVGTCSGGELKRLSIAIELTAHSKPYLLCIDEPTTGLDSNAAQLVMNCLYNLTLNHNMSILTSIHQPNTDIFDMFDSIHVLSKGFVIFTGKPQELKDFMSESNITCDTNESPIEVLLKVSANDNNNDSRIKHMIDKTSELNTHRFMAETNNIYYLIARRIRIQYIIQWKTLLAETVFHIMFATIVMFAINDDNWLKSLTTIIATYIIH